MQLPRIRPHKFSIKAWISTSFLVIAGVMVSLGAINVSALRHAGALVERTYDQSLMSINYGNLAAIDFLQIKGYLLGRKAQGEAIDQAALQHLTGSFFEDMAVALDRVQTADAQKAGGRVLDAMNAWLKRQKSLGSTLTAADWKALDRAAQEIGQALDDFRNVVAGDGFKYRQSAKTSTRMDSIVTICDTIIALVIAGVVSVLLGRRVLGSLRLAATVAEEIARGNLDTRVPDVGRDEVGKMCGAVEIMRQHIADLVTREQSLRSSLETRVTDALEETRDGVIIVAADESVAMANSQAAALLDAPPGSFVRGRRVDDILDALLQAGQDLRSVLQRPQEGHETLQTQLPGSGRWLRISRSLTREGGFVSMISDVSERVEHEQRIAHMAKHDALTNLPNRALFSERLEMTLSCMDRRRGCAVFFLDLDKFKAVNDTMGHAAGDDLLRQVAGRLKGCVRESDTVARFGGDEFAILLPGASRDNDTQSIAERIVKRLGRPFLIEGQEVGIGVSIGITAAPGDGMTRENLMRNADMALYNAKAEGRGTWRFFETRMNETVKARQLLEKELSAALERREFVLAYQPLLDLGSDEIVGYEALVRWQHPTRGLVFPGDFIQAAEEFGLISEIGTIVLEQACLDAAGWYTATRQPRKVAVNVSAVQLRNRGFPTLVGDILTRTGLDPSLLELEITESTVMNCDDTALDLLRELHSLGVRVAMDDFGTGHSSLASLQRLPFDKLKVDRSFLRDIGDSEKGPSARTIVSTIINLGKSLNLRVTVEGVETEDQLAWIASVGCNEAQGYLISKPVPGVDLAAVEARWLERRLRLVSMGESAEAPGRRAAG